MAMLNRNLRNNAAAVGAAARLLRQAAGDDVSYALLGVGFATCITAFRSAVSQPAESVLAYPVYLGALVVSLIGGLNIHMVIAVGLSNDHDVFFDILRAIA